MGQFNSLNRTQLFGLIFIFLLSPMFIGLPSGVKQDSWIVYLIAAIVMIPVVFLFVWRNKIIENRIVTAVLLLFALYSCGLAIRNFSEFARMMILPKTPIWLIAAVFALLCLYLQRQNMSVLGRYCVFIIPLILLVLAVTMLLSLDVMYFRRLSPILSQPGEGLLRDGIVTAVTAFLPLILLFGLVDKRDAAMSRLWWGYGLAILCVVVTVLRAILILGGEAYYRFDYPVYVSYSTLHVGNFMNRLEVFISGFILVFSVFRVAVFLKFLNLSALKLVRCKDSVWLSGGLLTGCILLNFFL